MPFACRLISGSLLALALQSVPAAAQYPDKPITVIVPFAAGGPTDVVARLVGDHMSRTLGQTLVVENIGGAGGTLGHDPRRPGAAGRVYDRGRQYGDAVGGACALSEPQIRSGEKLRAGRNRQPHAASDRGQERHPGKDPERVHRLSQG